MTERGEQSLMGPWMTAALVVGAMIGAGIFVLPSSLAPYGANAIIAWVVSGAGALALAFAFATLARQDGLGIQAYIERELGSWIGFLVAWSFWVSVWVSNAVLGLAAAAGLGRIVPVLSGKGQVPTAVVLILLLTLVNALGARAAGRTAVLTTLLKLGPLVAVVLLLGDASLAGRPVEPLAPMPIGLDAIAAASALTLGALLGFETATAPVGKIRDPARNVPRALLMGTAFVAAIYLLSSTAIMLLLPAATVASSAAPFAEALVSRWGEGAALFAAFGMAISAFGALNGGVLIAGELGYSLAQRGDLPRLLGQTDRRGTPIIGQWLAAGLAIALVLLNSDRGAAALITFIFLLTTCSTLYIYLAGCIAALRRRPSAFASAIILVGLLFTGFAFYGVGREANLWGLALLGMGAAIRLFMHRSRRVAGLADAPPAAAA